jgi:hypothetical protein
VSISTLRRKIKTKDVRYRLDQGKYFICDEELQRPSLKEVEVFSPSLKKDERATVTTEPESFSASIIAYSNQGEPVFIAANKLLTELKKAYSLILQEKEEQILNLREELSDLKTLVRVLESENERLKRF